MSDPTRPTLSLRQVSAAAGIGMRTTRTLVSGDWLPGEDLSPNHVFIARTVAALFDAPRSAAEGRGPLSSATEARYRKIVTDIYELLLRPNPQAVLLLAPDQHMLADDLFSGMGFFSREGKGHPVLVLPVGSWAAEVRDGSR